MPNLVRADISMSGSHDALLVGSKSDLVTFYRIPFIETSTKTRISGISVYLIIKKHQFLQFLIHFRHVS